MIANFQIHIFKERKGSKLNTVKQQNLTNFEIVYMQRCQMKLKSTNLIRLTIGSLATDLFSN